MLQFIIGKSGTGKTQYIFDEIEKLVGGGESKILLLVPDQSTFETEKAMLKKLGARKFQDIGVFGFQRLCRHVFEQTCMNFGESIDNGTKAMLMSVAIEEVADKLRLFKIKNNRSMTGLMLSTLNESQKHGVTAEMLREVSAKVEDSTLAAKLTDTALIFDAFGARLSQSYIDPNEDLDRLYDVLLDNPRIFSDYTVFFDAFSGFTAQQQKIVELLLDRCKRVCIALTFDPEISDKDYVEDAFATTRTTYSRVKRLANKLQIQIAPPVRLTEGIRFQRTRELAELEERIFRTRKLTPKPCTDPPENVAIYEASNPYDECEFVAKQIKKLIIEHGYLYSDISVICHDVSDYSGMIDVVFDKFEIPYFMDSRKDIDVKPVIRFVNSVFRMSLDNFERGDVLLLLKSGLTENSPDDIDIFENYIFKWNINNSAFKMPFTQNPRGFVEGGMNDNDERILEIANRVRASVVDAVSDFRDDIRDKTGREISERLYRLLCNIGVPDSLKKMQKSFRSLSDKEFGDEQIRIWNLLINVLDKVVAVAGDMRLSAGRYYELLSMQISSMDLSEIPRTLDSVSVTTAQRVRAANKRAVFLIGCAQGKFPSTPDARGLFSPLEIQILSQNDVKIGEETSELANLERFMAYTCMTAASEKLFASYYTIDLSGNLYQKSEIITELQQKAFKEIKTISCTDFKTDYRGAMYAVRPAFEEFSRSLSKGRTELAGLRGFFESDPFYSPKLHAVLRAIDKAPFAIENSSNAELLFGPNLELSATRLETYYKCPFSYFCTFGLRINERREVKIDQLESGNVIHKVMEMFFKRYKTKEQYAGLTEAQIKSFIGEAVDEYLRTVMGGEEQQSQAFLFQLNMMKNNLFYVVQHTVDALKNSEFEVSDCELKIPEDIDKHTQTLSSGQTISIKGKVDRVDIFEHDGIKYIRVIDYKSNKEKKLRIGMLPHGIDMQMLIYLNTIINEGKAKFGDALPAGVLYSPSHTGMIPEKSTDKKTESELLCDSLKMSGIVLGEDEVVDAIDLTKKKKLVSGALDNVKLTPSKMSKLFDYVDIDEKSKVTAERFTTLFDYVDLKIREMGERLYNGSIEAMPLRGAEDGCKYCKFDSICAYRKGKGVQGGNLKPEDAFRLFEDELSAAKREGEE